MTVLEQIQIEIGGKPYRVTLPENGRFEVDGDGWTLFCVPCDGDWFYLVNGDGEIIQPVAFPDACDNAIVWFMERIEMCDDEHCKIDLSFEDDIEFAKIRKESTRAKGQWRAAKRAHLAIKEADRGDRN